MKSSELLFLSFVIVLAMTIQACTGATPAIREPLDYGEPQMEVSYNRQPFDRMIENSDVLVVAKCEKVSTRTPADGYTTYVFMVTQVLGGDFHEKVFRVVQPRASVGGVSVGTDEFETGETYLIPLVREDILFETYYKVPGVMSLCLSQNRYRANLCLDVPEMKNANQVQKTVLSIFNRVEHDPIPTVKEYSDAFEEFYSESSFIGRMKVVKAESNTQLCITYCECVELYKGDPEKMGANSKTGLVRIVVKPGTINVGEEYIIGFTNNQISTKDSVKEVSDELILLIRKALQNSF